MGNINFWQNWYGKLLASIFWNGIHSIQRRKYFTKILLAIFYIFIFVYLYLPCLVTGLLFWCVEMTFTKIYELITSKVIQKRIAEKKRLESLEVNNDRLKERNTALAMKVREMDKSKPSVLIAHIQATMSAFDQSIADINTNENLTPYLKAKRTANIEAVRDHMLAKYMEDI